ncbi:MAG: FAD:protein FMN transferase [Candidatus Nanopelagicales bacterium]
MITVGIQTWKTDLLLSVRHRPNAALEAQLQRLLTGEVARLERLASRFRSDSELATVNAGAGRWVEVSWGFVTVLTAALDAAQRTAGLVDPTMGRAIKAAGYDQWAGQTTPTNPGVHRGRWREVGIRPGRRQAQVQIPAGTELDLGSVAKGWLADRIATAVSRSGHEVCANMGGDVRVIAGQPWTVWSDPGIPGDPGAPVDLLDAAMATSGVGRRAWTGGHHIIDPRTGFPAKTPWWSVTAVAATAADANAAATAGVILGDRGPGWMTQHHIDARFVSRDKTLTTGRWMQEAVA